jgi:4-hydroxy-3-polyprenylbenzoate decarboxylase
VKRIVVAITGASGALYGIRLLELIRKYGLAETHLIVTGSGRATIHAETDYTVSQVNELADTVYHNADLGAAISSGSYRTDGMIIAPCSVKTLSGIAHSYDDTLAVRAADVLLKERKPVVLVFRETPLHRGHIRLMADASDNGAILMPPVPAFYHRPHTLDDLILHTVGRILDQVGLELPHLPRWPTIGAESPDR